MQLGHISQIALGSGGRLLAVEATQTARRHPRPRGYLTELVVFNLKAAGTQAFVVGRDEVGLDVVDTSDAIGAIPLRVRRRRRRRRSGSRAGAEP
jgi:hypothetical protein